ncbi:MAG: A/G-specific adenine glycosylase [Anaerolineales bacterium]
MSSPIAKNLLRWYSSRQRDLPWRKRPRPYAVWVAEVMAQQTRLETMLPYYRRWMRRFPTIHSLAGSSEQDVLLLWEGLGYYGRARNLRRAAQQVVREFGGRLPLTAEALRRLPGIGRYTAGAIASLAFGADEPAVDGNAIRVLARVFNVKLLAGSSAAQVRFWTLAAAHLPPGRAAEYNQALMDLGAELCLPRKPKCGVCPLRADCRAKALGIQEQRPVKVKPKAVPTRHFAAAVIRQGGRVLVVQRPAAGLLGSLWEFPNVRLSGAHSSTATYRRALKKDLGFALPLGQHLGDFSHQYSHFNAHLRAFHTSLNGSRPRVDSQRVFRWVPLAHLQKLPMGKLDRRIAEAYCRIEV